MHTTQGLKKWVTVSVIKYAHNYNNHYVQQQYLPDELVDRVYYEMSDNGEEVKMKKWMQYIKENSNE